MSIEKLDEQVRLPLDVPAIMSGDPKELANYITELISELQDFRIHDIHERVNLLLDITPGGIIYLGEKDDTGDYPDGTWRLNGESSSEYLIQLTESGTWTTKSTLSSAGIATLVGLVLSGLTASRLTSTDANKQLTSVDDLTQWIAGTDLEIDVTDIGDGTVKISIVDPLAVSKGGTGAASLTDGGIVLGSGTAPVTVLGQATNGQIPIGSTGADPVLATITAGDGIDVASGAGSVQIDADLKANGGLVIETTEIAVDLGASSITGTLSVGDGGTSATTLTDGGFLLGSGTSAVTATAQPTNGQLPIGSTGADPVLATLTGTARLTVANAAGSVSLDVADPLALSGLTVTNAAVLGSNSVVFQPAVDSTTFFQILDADGGTPVLNVDTVNERVGIGTATLPSHKLVVGDNFNPGITGSPNRIVLGNSVGNCYFNIGQQATNSLEVGWVYNATPALAYAKLATYAYSNDLDIDAKNVVLQARSGLNVGIGEHAPETLLELTHATPYITGHCSTHADTDGSGAFRIIGKREQSGGEETASAQIEMSHDGAADDQLGKQVFSVNTGAGLVEAVRIDSNLTVKTSGGRIANTTSIDDGDSPYTILVSDHVILCDTDSGNITAYLPLPVAGQIFYAKNTGAGVVTVDADTVGSTTIDGDTTQTINQYECLQVISDGTVWWAI